MTSRVEAWFSWFAQQAAYQTGRPHSFAAAVVLTALWAVSGPIFGYSDTWQLVINTGTTVLTWWMVFLLQNTQNRDTTELKLKLDELILANESAKNAMIPLEEKTEDDLRDLKRQVAEDAGDR